MQTAVSEEGLGVEHEVITLILRRQHQGAAPAFSGVDPYLNIIQIWKSRSIVRFDGGQRPDREQLLIGPLTASLIPTPETCEPIHMRVRTSALARPRLTANQVSITPTP